MPLKDDLIESVDMPQHAKVFLEAPTLLHRDYHLQLHARRSHNSDQTLLRGDDVILFTWGYMTFPSRLEDRL